jgi:hypothetical protein
MEMKTGFSEEERIFNSSTITVIMLLSRIKSRKALSATKKKK